MFDKKTLKDNLKKSFASRIFSRGASYYRTGSVKSLKAFPGQNKKNIIIKGVVGGTDDYWTQINFEFGKNRFSGVNCSCPYYDRCKHAVALGLEFIDALEEFMKECDFVLDDEFRDNLIGWINRQDKAARYIEKSSKKAKYVLGEDADEDDDDFFDEDLGWEDDDFDVDLEENTEEDRYKNMTREELLEELKVWAGIGDAPQSAIDGVVQELAKRGKAPNTAAKDVGGKKALSLPKEKKSADKVIAVKREKIKKEFEPDKFKIAINLDSYFDIDIYGLNNKIIYPYKLLDKYSGFTEEQKEIFSHISKFKKAPWQYDMETDWVKVFNMIKASGLRIFKKAGYYAWDTRLTEMFFAQEPEKLKAGLVLKKEYVLNCDYTRHNFIFSLDRIYEVKRGERNNKFFISGEQIACVIGNTIHINYVPLHIAAIIARINLQPVYYYTNRDKAMETVLTEDEILNLNNIISDGQKYLDLKTDLTPDYNLQKYNQAKPSLEIDYSAEDGWLEVLPVVDYGFCRHDVSETVYYAKGKYKRGYKRREYRGQIKYVMGFDDKDISHAPLAADKEKALFKSFYGQDKTGFSKTLKCRRQGEDQVFDFYKNNFPEIKKIASANGYEIKFVRDEFNFIEDNFQADFKVDLNAENDWLWFDVDCYCGQDKVGLAELRRYIDEGKEFIKMADGRWLKITNYEELERFVMMLESFYEREKGGFEGKLYHAPELENIFTSSKHYNAKVKSSFNKFIKEAKSGRPVKKTKLKPAHAKVMRAYQKEGVDWFYFLRKYRFAGILADDMGLGKTLQTLALLEMEKKKNRPSLVVCPKSLLYNWEAEAKKFTPELAAAVIDGTPAEREAMIKKAKKSDLIITGYATMKKDADIYEKEKIKFNYCVLDEAQFIKNHATKNARIVKKVNADYRLALTGTPLENSVSEIWSVFDFLMPGFLGSYKSFVKKFQTPIMKNNSAAALDNLRRKVECFMLRRTKGEVLKELPPKVDQKSLCYLEKEQNILYQEILANVKSDIFEAVKSKGFNNSRIHILAGLTKLRQVCNHPSLLLKDGDYSKYESAKLNMFSELMDEIVGNKRKVLVFSQFTKMLDILASELDKSQISYNYLSGQTKNRQKLVDDFNNNADKQVFLISLKAGGTGLNLTAADNVVIFDPWWNPSVENQAIDRAHRIGQKNSVNVYRLITHGTIEEKIVKLQEKKQFLFDNLVGESKDLFKKLTWDDIRGLFK
jgi:SNF2 family DNA or RNA helicase